MKKQNPLLETCKLSDSGIIKHLLLTFLNISYINMVILRVDSLILSKILIHHQIMGRRKIEMKMVKDSNSRQVTFSKRRNGLFKKANELATLCAAHIAIVVFSPGGKPFSFGHPSVDVVVQRLLNWEMDPKDETNSQVDAEQEAKVEQLNEQLIDLVNQLEIEKKRGEMLDKALKAKGLSNYCKKSINDLGLDELLHMKASLEKLRENLKSHIDDMEASSSLLLLKGATKENDG